MSRRTARHRRILAVLDSLALSAITTGCSPSAPLIAGSWVGDVTVGDRADRIEVSVDSGGTRARITFPAWQLDSVTADRVTAGRDTPLFVSVIQNDTMRLTGAPISGEWHGGLSLGERHASVHMIRRFGPGPVNQRAMFGVYRAPPGHFVAITPFSEFGTEPMLVDYGTGRIGPVYPLSRDRLVVGRSLVSPIFPADSLTLISSGPGTVEGLRFAESGRPVVVATRLATREEEVEFQNGAVRLAGTLFLPPGPPPYPGIVLVHGSNAQTRDALGPWSGFFAALGFAVLSYDKRGTGRSTGDWRSADFEELAGDVLAGLRFLRRRVDITPTRVGAWGISQAGWILPIVAAKAPSEVAFLILHAGSGTTVRQEGILYLQSELRAAGLPPSSVAIGTRYQELDDRVTATGNGWEELQRYYEEHRTAEPWLWPPRGADDWFRAYYRMLMDFDPAPYWRRVRCPVLLFFGELDANVPPAESWPPIERALRQGGNAGVTSVLLPTANHLFLAAKTGGRDEYPGLSRFVPGYFSRIADWLVTMAHDR